MILISGQSSIIKSAHQRQFKAIHAEGKKHKTGTQWW